MEMSKMLDLYEIHNHIYLAADCDEIFSFHHQLARTQVLCIDIAQVSTQDFC